MAESLAESWQATRFSLTDMVRPWDVGLKRIVLVTGYFDIFHAGHVRFLLSCKIDTNEQLIVGVHSDELARQQKGPDRPILKLEHRLAVVQSLRVVDYVFRADAFYDMPPHRILEFVKPDYVVLSQEGEDIGRKSEISLSLASWPGLKIRRVGLEPPILHTSGIIDRIRSHERSNRTQ